jgi:hypothetical protein
MKIVINNCFGGFSLSSEGIKRYCELKGIPHWIEIDTQFKSMELYTVFTVPKEERIPEKRGEDFYSMNTQDRIEYNKAYSKQILDHHDIPRDDAALVQLVEEDSVKYSGMHAELKVVEIPDGIKWIIEEYDGNEHVAEEHRVWY